MSLKIRIALSFMIVLIFAVACVMHKPIFFSADYHEQEITRTMAVFYGDFPEAEVRQAVSQAVDEFYRETNIKADVQFYRRVFWVSREFYAMSAQVFELYPEHSIPADWVLMIYKKTPLEYFMMVFVGSVDGLAEVGGHWALVNRLKSDLIIHEMYHLGCGIQ